MGGWVAQWQSARTTFVELQVQDSDKLCLGKVLGSVTIGQWDFN